MNRALLIICIALFLIAIYFAVRFHVLNEKVKMYRIAGSVKEDAKIIVEQVQGEKPKPEAGKSSFFQYE